MAELKPPHMIHPSCQCITTKTEDGRDAHSHANLVLATAVVDQMRTISTLYGLCNYDVIVVLCGAMHSYALQSLPVDDKLNKDHAFGEVDVAVKKYREDYDSWMSIPEELRNLSTQESN